MAGRPPKNPNENLKTDRMLGKAIEWIASNDEPDQKQWDNLTVISKQKAVVLAAQLFELRPEEIAFKVIDSRMKQAPDIGVRP